MNFLPFTVIDTHIHYWQYDALHADFDWINAEMDVLKKDFSPQSFHQENHQIYSKIFFVAVQARESIEETDFLLKIAEQNNQIKGVVGWVPMENISTSRVLDSFQNQAKLKGFRHIIQDMPAKLLLSDQMLDFIDSLDGKFTYDLLIKPHQLLVAHKLVKLFPNQKFVIDHIAKPNLKSNDLMSWKHDLALFSDCNNVYCKLSGMVTEADWKSWDICNFSEAIHHVFQVFGTSRIMFGSDWPVSLLAATYNQVFEIAYHHIVRYDLQVQEDLFQNNAIKFYNL
jgi:L-fuconolactonase